MEGHDRWSKVCTMRRARLDFKLTGLFYDTARHHGARWLNLSSQATEWAAQGLCPSVSWEGLIPGLLQQQSKLQCPAGFLTWPFFLVYVGFFWLHISKAGSFF